MTEQHLIIQELIFLLTNYDMDASLDTNLIDPRGRPTVT